MVRGQRPKPTSQRKLEGKRGHRPLNQDEPTSPALQSVPSDLDPALTAAWQRIVRVAPPGVLRCADEIMVETAARLLVRAQAPDAPLSALAQLRQALGELGMTPSARARLAVPAPPVENPFDAI